MILLTIVVLGSGCIGKGKTYIETVTNTYISTETSHSTVEMVTFTTSTVTITISTTQTIVKTETTTINGSTTITTTTYLNNVTYTTITTIVTFYYGNDGKPNIVYYEPVTNQFEIEMDISVTTVYYPESLSNLYTPIFPVFIFYDKEYYRTLESEIGITKYPENPVEYITIFNKLKSKIVIVKTSTYPTFLHVAIENGTMNEIELANYFVGVAILSQKEPTLVLISNYTTSTMGVIVDGVPLIGTRAFGNTEAMKAYYYNIFSNHIEYYAVVNKDYPTITIFSETISEGTPLIGLMKNAISYIITVTINYRGNETIYTRTGSFNTTWGTFIEVNAIGDTITAYVHNSTIFMVTNTFTTNTYEYNPSNLTTIFLPEPFREADIYYLGESKILLEDYDVVNSIWLVITVYNNIATGTFINKYGESVGSYEATLLVVS